MFGNLPLSLLRAFEAAGRTGSFRNAAQELHLSPSAISHAIRKLEDHIGIKLFLRSTRSIQLTPEAEALFVQISKGFEDIRRGRSEERRVGKECRSRGSPGNYK